MRELAVSIVTARSDNKLACDKLLSEACLYINKGVTMPYILHAMYTIASTLCIHNIIVLKHTYKITTKCITVAIV